MGKKHDRWYKFKKEKKRLKLERKANTPAVIEANYENVERECKRIQERLNEARKKDLVRQTVCDQTSGDVSKPSEVSRVVTPIENHAYPSVGLANKSSQISNDESLVSNQEAAKKILAQKKTASSCSLREPACMSVLSKPFLSDGETREKYRDTTSACSTSEKESSRETRHKVPKLDNLPSTASKSDPCASSLISEKRKTSQMTSFSTWRSSAANTGSFSSVSSDDIRNLHSSPSSSTDGVAATSCCSLPTKHSEIVQTTPREVLPARPTSSGHSLQNLPSSVSRKLVPCDPNPKPSVNNGLKVKKDFVEQFYKKTIRGETSCGGSESTRVQKWLEPSRLFSARLLCDWSWNEND